MARKIKRTHGEKRFTVMRINGDDYDTHASRSFERAMNLALPDRGALVEVFSVCARDAGSARLPSTYRQRGYLTRKFRFKRRG